MAPEDALLVGPLSLDRYLTTGEDLPGGGALNMAYHWSVRQVPFELVSRVGTGDRDLFEAFLDRHGIRRTSALVTEGPSCSIDVVFADDRQPVMDNFVEGTWADFRFTGHELARISAGAPTHLVLVDPVDHELHRVAGTGSLDGARLTGDFLSFRHFTVERFAATLAHLDVGFVGWPGDPDDPTVVALGAHADATGKVLVVTLGSRGIRVFDGRRGDSEPQWFDVDAREVTGTTVGCGDAFIAAFLDEWHRTADLAAAVDAGRRLGAEATTWDRPLPDRAYA